MKVGAKRDYDLKMAQGISPKGEAGLLIRFTRGEEKLLLFLGKAEVTELLGQLHDAQFELLQRESQ